MAADREGGKNNEKRTAHRERKIWRLTLFPLNILYFNPVWPESPINPRPSGYILLWRLVRRGIFGRVKSQLGRFVIFHPKLKRSVAN
jgi:hypothetical protein